MTDINNITTTFLVRPLGVMDKTETAADNKLKQIGFVQAFIKDAQREDVFKYPVLLVFKITDSLENEFLEEFIANEYLKAKTPNPRRGTLVLDYDYTGYVVLVYEFPEYYRDDYETIVAGKYSHTSEEFKHIFPMKMATPGGRGETTSYTHQIFNRDNTMREMWEAKIDTKLGWDAEVRSVGNWDNFSDLRPKEILDIDDY